MTDELKPLTDEELDQLDDLLERATPAPWSVRTNHMDIYKAVEGPDGQLIFAEPTASTAQSGAWSTFEGEKADWELAPALRNIADRLVAEVRRLRAMVCADCEPGHIHVGFTKDEEVVRFPPRTDGTKPNKP
jgi:hypothetical protein